MPIVNHANYCNACRVGGELPRGKSLTVPNMVLPLSELLVRYARGNPVAMSQSFYDDEHSVDINLLSPTERAYLSKELREDIEVLREELYVKSKKSAPPVSSAPSVPPAPSEPPVTE